MGSKVMISRTIVTILMFSLSLSLPIRAQQKPSQPRRDFSEVRKLIQTQMAARGIPSVSVAVARRGEILWEEAFGFADKEKGIRANNETMYYVASVSKTFTATALKVLEERKQIDFNRPINDYLKPMAVTSPLWDPKEATVGRVATHMSGLTTFGRNCWTDTPDCRIVADETMKRYGTLFWRPGDHFDYSNLGYGILGEAIEHASGKSYADYMRNEVFLPLGMTRASVGIGPGLEKYAAVRYSLVNGRRPVAKSASPGASGVYCNAHGLALFGMFHLKAHLAKQKAILSDESIEMMQNSTVSAGGSSRYGIGWWVHEDLNGYRGLLGQGGTDDAMAFLRLIPSEEIAVVVLTNTGDDFPPKIVDEILSELLPPFRARREAASNTKPQPKPETKPSAALVGNWTGQVHTYRKDMPLRLSVSESGDIQARFGSVSSAPLNKFEFTERGLIGRLTGANLGTDEDTGTGPYDFDVELYVKDETLYGAVTTRPRPGDFRGARLSYWVELRRDAAPITDKVVE